MLVRTDFRDMLPLGWRHLSDVVMVRAALESATGGDDRPLADLRADGRVLAVPDLSEVEVVRAFAGMALVAFQDDDGKPVECWTARAAVEPWEADGDVDNSAGNPHRGTTSRPKPPRY